MPLSWCTKTLPVLPTNLTEPTLKPGGSNPLNGGETGKGSATKTNSKIEQSQVHDWYFISLGGRETKGEPGTT